MTRAYFNRPFKTRTWRGIPNYVAITAMLMLAVTIVPGFDSQGDAQDLRGPAQPQQAPAASTSSGAEAGERVKRKLNVRLSLFRHG